MRERGGGGGGWQRGTWGESENRGREGGRKGGREEGWSEKGRREYMYMYKRNNAQPQEPSKERFQQQISL